MKNHNTIRVLCDNADEPFEVTVGTPLTEIAQKIPQGKHPWLAAMVDNRIKGLHYLIYKPVTVRFVDITSFEGTRVYQRTAWLLLQKAVRDLYPHTTLHIRHSMGQSGFYCEIDGIEQFSQAETQKIEARMRELVEKDLQIIRRRLPSDEVRKIYKEQGFDDRIALLDTRPRLYGMLYILDDVSSYFYGDLTPSTGYIDRFGIAPYYNGFYLALPVRTEPERLGASPQQAKMFGIFQEYQSWVRIMGVPTVGDVNTKALAGDGGGMIKLAEAFHERKFAWVADSILEAHKTRGVRMVLISGPSSSGKTTSAKRLGLQLGVLGLQPVLISLDDYFVDREKTPLDAEGNYDYEALEAIDVPLFNEHLRALLRGESVEIPRYDFVTGRRQWHQEPLTLTEHSMLIVEGIHGLDPRLTPGVPDDQKFRIYISCFTSVAMDNLTRISTTDNRLLRRLTRDQAQRGISGVETLARWPKVQEGEEKYIFPYQENADVMLNSSLFYEISVLRPYAERLLQGVPDTVPEYNEAQRMLKFLDNFVPISADEVPPTSILREFIGGSSFTY